MEEKEGSTRIGPASGRDWTQGNILGNFLRLSWPMVISQTLTMAGPLVDMIWVGRLGSISIVIVGIGGIIIVLVMTMVMGLAMGTRAMVARFMGARDVRAANHVAQQSLVIGLAFSIVMAAVGVFSPRQVCTFLGWRQMLLLPGHHICVSCLSALQL